MTPAPHWEEWPRVSSQKEDVDEVNLWTFQEEVHLGHVPCAALLCLGIYRFSCVQVTGSAFGISTGTNFGKDCPMVEVGTNEE